MAHPPLCFMPFWLATPEPWRIGAEDAIAHPLSSDCILHGYLLGPAVLNARPYVLWSGVLRSYDHALGTGACFSNPVSMCSCSSITGCPLRTWKVEPRLPTFA